MPDNVLFNFARQTAIAPGGAQGIGLELGRFFQEAQATVYLVDLDGDGVEKAAASIGARAHHADGQHRRGQRCRGIASIPKEKRRELTAAIPMQRFAQPEEMATTVGFLASKEAGYVTGVALRVDGGISM
jgi:NAD(P)-dependent dehydrogenase (short-subunit alcohol dehydrogenase family)